MEKRDPINDLLTEHGSDVHPADISQTIVNSKTVSINPDPMPIEQAVELYKRLDDVGKGRFVDCFNPDEQDVLRKALADAGELIYTPSGLHQIIGKCILAEVDETAEADDPHGDYTIETDEHTYRIYLNLPLGEQYVPENQYPKIGDRVVIHAETIHEDDGVLTGYAEACWIGKTDKQIEKLRASHGYCVVEAS